MTVVKYIYRGETIHVKSKEYPSTVEIAYVDTNCDYYNKNSHEKKLFGPARTKQRGCYATQLTLLQIK